MYKEGQKFLESWCNDTKNDCYEKDLKEYGEKEVEDMLYEYRIKFSLPEVVKPLKYYKKISFEEYMKLHNVEIAEHGTTFKDGEYMGLSEFLMFREKYYKL